MKQTLRIIILCYSFILFEGLLFSMLADTGKAEKEVLVLNSINFNLPWSKHFYWCVHDELQQRGVSVKAESLSVPALLDTMEAVSYTHLDVYKRQALDRAMLDDYSLYVYLSDASVE